MQACIHKRVHTYIHTYIYTHIYLYVFGTYIFDALNPKPETAKKGLRFRTLADAAERRPKENFPNCRGM